MFIRLTFLILAVFVSMVAHATTNSSTCLSDLKDLVVTKFQTNIDKSSIFPEIDDNRDGVYRIKLSVSADNPNHSVTIGWVELNTNTRAAYDITKDDQHPEILNVESIKYEKYIDKCLSNISSGKTTNLPFVFDKYYQCSQDPLHSVACQTRYYVYPINVISKDEANQIGIDADQIVIFPPQLGMKIYLAARTETDVNVYYLAVFNKDKLISKMMVGKMDGVSILTFDISKDYLLTTYQRKGDMGSKIIKVNHFKVENNGSITNCTNTNPTCR